MINIALTRQFFNCKLIAYIASCFIFSTGFVGAEEALSFLWHGANLAVEVPDNFVRVDNAYSDLANIIKKQENYALLFAFVDGQSLNASSETRLNGDSAPLPYATISIPHDYLIPGRLPSMTPAECVEAINMFMACSVEKTFLGVGIR